MKVFINLLYNSGVERKYEMNLGSSVPLEEDDIKRTIEYLKNDVINKAFEKGANGFIEFTSIDEESVSVNLQSVAEVKFKTVI